MAIIIKHVKTKCLQCKSPLAAKAKVDQNTGSIKKYVEIYGGERRDSPFGYKANFCNKCLKNIDKKEVELSLNFFKGDRVKYSIKPEWGIGHVLFDGKEEHVRVYFVNVGEKKIILKHNDLTYKNLIRVYGDEAHQPLLEVIADANYERDGHHHIYVIELDKSVLNNYKFKEANQCCDPSKPCVYIGLTGLTPEERFENHKIGHKSSHFPHLYGKKLLPGFYKYFNPMPYDKAKIMEEELANAFRMQGFAVWQN